MELSSEVGDVGETVEVSFQDIPAHLIVERVTELWWHLEEEDRKRLGKIYILKTIFSQTLQ